MRSKRPKAVKSVGEDSPAATSEVQDSVSARELNLSSRQFRRLAAAGKIPSFRTPSGNVRVLRRDLDEYVQSSSSSSVPGLPSRVDSGREENQMLSLEFQRRRLQRDLQRLNEEDAEGRRNRGEAADAERAQLEQARLEREERDRQREESERRQFWLDAQIEFALQSIPPDIAGRFASEIQLSVEAALQALGPGRPQPIVERVI